MLIDSHCHLPHKNYARPTSDVLNAARDAGVVKFINIGTHFSNNIQVIELANNNNDVFAAIGVYPHEERNIPVDQLKNTLRNQLASSNKIVGVGECGLDITDLSGARDTKEQIAIFEMQLQLAVELGLPVIIHNRGGDDLIFDIMAPFVNQGLTGVAHCFASDWDVAKKYLDIGFYISFSGMLTYKSRRELQDVAIKVPNDKFLVETDSPYLPPDGFRGQPNEPMHVVEVAQKIALLKNLPFEKVADLSYSSTCRLFTKIC